MALSAQVPPSPRRVTGGQGQEARDDGGAPLRSHDRGGYKGGKFITTSKLSRLTVAVTVVVTTLLLLLFWLGF